ncbi:hypothetical protein GCM10017687_83990 [Streptomyces echinatus]|uniref:hypothetical protein n=1 Tax=Streptomyces echinatus TaxID=67293 RepID=UPI0031E67436
MPRPRAQRAGSIDVIEIDAPPTVAWTTPVSCARRPSSGPRAAAYKIYIIDEAHMVTSAGFNALLKVVEEPPEHLKFIFATTEPEKVIGTIRSRTHHYPFRLVPGTLREYLGEVVREGGHPGRDGVLPLVVRAGAGSVRDSMSVMDQLLAGAGEEGVTYAMATSLLGYTDGSLLRLRRERPSPPVSRGRRLRGRRPDHRATTRGASSPTCWSAAGPGDPGRAVPDAVRRGSSTPRPTSWSVMRARPRRSARLELSRAADLVNEGLTEMRGATSPRLQMD